MDWIKEKFAERPIMMTLVGLFLLMNIVSILFYGLFQLKLNDIDGSYSGQAISVYLNPVEEESQDLTGWVAIKGHTYPVNATVSGRGKASGTYYANGSTFPIAIEDIFAEGIFVTTQNNRIPVKKFNQDSDVDGEWTANNAKAFLETQEDGTIHVLVKLENENGAQYTDDHPNYLAPKKYMLNLNRFGNIFQGSARNGVNNFAVEGALDTYDQNLFLTIDGLTYRFSYGKEKQSSFLNFAGNYREKESNARFEITFVREFKKGKRTGQVLADGRCFIPEWGEGFILECTPDGPNLIVELFFHEEPCYTTLTLTPTDVGFETSYTRDQGTALDNGNPENVFTREFSRI